MSKEEFLENLKNWDGKYESLIPPTGLPDPANWKEFQEALNRRIKTSDFYIECIDSLWEKADEEYKNQEYLTNPQKFMHVSRRELLDWRYGEYHEELVKAFSKEYDENCVKQANLLVSMANLYDIFKEHPQAAKLWGKNMGITRRRIIHQGASDALDNGEITYERADKCIEKAFQNTEPFNPKSIERDFYFFDGKNGKVIHEAFYAKNEDVKAETEAMTL